jgi:hypothetical protein
MAQAGGPAEEDVLDGAAQLLALFAASAGSAGGASSGGGGASSGGGGGGGEPSSRLCAAPPPPLVPAPPPCGAEAGAPLRCLDPTHDERCGRCVRGARRGAAARGRGVPTHGHSAPFFLARRGDGECPLAHAP